MSGFYSETVSRLRPGVKQNRALESVPDYDGLREAPGLEWERVHVRPVSQTEVVGTDRATAVSQWLLASEPGSGDFDVVSTDWVRLPDGTVCQVIGAPARPTDPLSGGLHHIQLLLEEAHG